MRRAALFAMAAMVVSIACRVPCAEEVLAAEVAVPLPPPRPPKLAEPSPAANPVPPVVSEKDRAACRALMEDGAVRAESRDPVRGDGGCGIDAPVVLRAIVLPDKSLVQLVPAPTLRCDLAAALARWIRNDVVPALAAQKLALQSIATNEAYSCRPRNRVAGAKLSEHGRGNAIDFDAFIFSPTRRIPLTSAEAAPFASLVRASACARFATVLGPGSDALHETHIHVDLEDRQSHASLCQWQLP